MLAIKARYNRGIIELLEPIPADIISAELNIVVIPSEPKEETVIPQDSNHTCVRSSEEEFKLIGLAAFFDTEDDANVDWEDYFGLN
jgi:limonene-1,2-epoxide hydrolase